MVMLICDGDETDVVDHGRVSVLQKNAVIENRNLSTYMKTSQAKRHIGRESYKADFN